MIPNTFRWDTLIQGQVLGVTREIPEGVPEKVQGLIIQLDI